MSSVLKVDNIEKYYGSKANLTKAIDRISFEVEEGEFPCLKSLHADNKVMTIAPIAQYWNYGGFRKWEDDIIKLYFNDRSGDCGKYYDQWNGYHKIERKTSFKIQTRGIRIYLPRL